MAVSKTFCASARFFVILGNESLKILLRLKLPGKPALASKASRLLLGILLRFSKFVATSSVK